MRSCWISCCRVATGLSVLRQMRERGLRTPVLLLTARGTVSERVEGLNAGADDYLSKPFALAELIARLRALGRRGGEAKPLLLRLGDLTLDTVTREVKRGGCHIESGAARIPLARVSDALARPPAQPHGHRRKRVGI